MRRDAKSRELRLQNRIIQQSLLARPEFSRFKLTPASLHADLNHNVVAFEVLLRLFELQAQDENGGLDKTIFGADIYEAVPPQVVKEL
jgi:hypothetical protein